MFNLISEFSLNKKSNNSISISPQDFINGAGTAITAVGLLGTKRGNKLFTSGVRLAGRGIRKIYNPKSSKNIINRIGNNIGKKLKAYENSELNSNSVAYTAAGLGGGGYGVVSSNLNKNKK